MSLREIAVGALFVKEAQIDIQFFRNFAKRLRQGCFIGAIAGPLLFVACADPNKVPAEVFNNGVITAETTCSEGNDFGPNYIPSGNPHDDVRININSDEIDTGPDGIFTVVSELSSKRSVIINYTGPNNHLAKSILLHGEADPMNFDPPLKFFGGGSYVISLNRGVFTIIEPILGAKMIEVAKVDFITPSCPGVPDFSPPISPTTN